MVSSFRTVVCLLRLVRYMAVVVILLLVYLTADWYSASLITSNDEFIAGLIDFSAS